MVKTELKPFETVSAFKKTLKSFENAKAKLDSNLKYLIKLYGDKGGILDLVDGKLLLTAREENGRDSIAYKAIVEGIEEALRAGKLHQMSKGDAIRFFDLLKEEKTNPQLSTQKVEVIKGVSVEKMDFSNPLVKTI